MKKCYRAPELEIVVVDNSDVVCMSNGEGTEDEVISAAQVRETYRSSLWND